MQEVWVLWIGPGHRCATCVGIPADWLASYRKRVAGEWRGRILGVYRQRVTKKEIFHVAYARLPHAKQAAAEMAVRCDVLADYARGDCHHGGAPLMTDYPNEDEGPDEVNWQEPHMSEKTPQAFIEAKAERDSGWPEMTSPRHTSLLPCPFCQSAVQFRKALHICDGNTDAIIHAEPSNCGMAQFEDGSTDESIVAKWNTRSVNAVPDLIAALDQISGVCEDNAPDSCDKKMALDFVRQVAAAAVAKVKP
jgi:hypothetical protein